MKKYLKTNAILLCLLALSAVAGIVVIAGRWQVEAANKTYDIVLDYNELELMAEQSGHDVSWWLNRFREMGITKVGVTEENLTTLMEDCPLNVTATMMDEVMQDAGWQYQYPERFIRGIEEMGYDRFDILVEASGSDAIDFVAGAVKERFPEGSYFQVVEDVLPAYLNAVWPGDSGERAYILLDGSVGDTLYTSIDKYNNTKGSGFTERSELVSSKLMYVSLGLLPEEVENVQSAGMEVIPRTLCYDGHNGRQFAEAVVKGYERYGIVPDYIIAGGEAVIGLDDSDSFALDYMAENGITAGLIESNVQRGNIMQSGVGEIAEATDYNTVRVFSVWDYIQFRYAYYGYTGAEEIENTLYRAIVERNIRIIYFKPIRQTDDYHVYVTDLEVYRQLFDGLNQRLATHGISLGRASVMENYQVPGLAMLVLGLGAGIGGALLPATCLPVKRKWTLALAAAAAVCVLGAWLAMPNSFRLLASFASAVVFACLAAAFFLRSAKQAGQALPPDAGLLKILPRAVLVLAAAAAVSLVGAVMTAAPLSSTDFMLELGIFRGVKAAQLLPLAFFCVLFMAYYGVFERGREEDTLRLRDVAAVLRWNLPVWALLLAAAVGLAGYYYLARTGHESNVEVSTLEIIFRNDLENLLLARPRTKEFLVAFPCIMLAVYAAVRRLPFWTALFGLAGTIGLTSVCNTFMHIRTPLYLGFIRTAYSLLLGIVLGALYMAVFELLLRLYRLAVKKYGETE